MGLRRFHFRSGDRVGDTVRLKGNEARHLSVVIRSKPGDRVVLVSERGDEFYATVVRSRGDEAVLSIQGEAEAGETLAGSIDIAVALAKGRAMERILAGATELGIRAVTVVPSARSVPRLDAAAVPGRLERWRRITTSAAKLSGRAKPAAVEYLPRWEEVPPRLSRYDSAFIAKRGGEPAIPRMERSDAVVLLVGPEGGFTAEEESSLLERGALPLGLGPFTLRCETAVIAAASLLVHAMLVLSRPSGRGAAGER